MPPLARVVAVGDSAWTLNLLMQRRRIEEGDLVLTWEAGQSSALDEPTLMPAATSETSLCSAVPRAA